MSALDPVQRPKIRYKYHRMRVLGERETIKRLTLTSVEAAKMLGVSRGTLYMLLKTRRLQAYKLDSKTVFFPADLRTFLSKLPPWSPE